MLRAQKRRTTLAFLPLAPHRTTWNFPGSLSGLPGGRRDWNQVQKRAQVPAMLPGSAEALPGDANVGFAPFDEIINAEGALGPPLSIPLHPRPMGGH